MTDAKTRVFTVGRRIPHRRPTTWAVKTLSDMGAEDWDEDEEAPCSSPVRTAGLHPGPRETAVATPTVTSCGPASADITRAARAAGNECRIEQHGMRGEPWGSNNGG